MATFEKGILGGFDGLVGTVIGGNWKGISYMRSRPPKRRGESSNKQLIQQAKFLLMVQFLRPFNRFLMISFNNYAIHMTGTNSAFRYNYKNAITGKYPDYAIKYSLVLVSRGDLPNATNPEVTSNAAGLVTFNWINNAGAGNSQDSDLAMLLVYCPALKQSIYTTGGATRVSETDSLDCAAFKGETVETWIGFISEDGKEIADSIYTGELNL